MKEGKTLSELATVIEAQAKSKRDFVAPTDQLEVINPSVLKVGKFGEFAIGSIAHDQIAEKTGIPAKYYDRMRADAPELYATNVNHWFRNQPAKRMVRTLEGRARAFLSEKFRPIDNYEIAESVLPILQEKKLLVRSCEVTEKHLWIKVISPDVKGEVKKGEPICAGFSIRNSEVGCGAFAIESFVEFLICTNGMRGADMLRKFHTGSRTGGTEGAWEFFRDETRLLSDKALFAQVQDLTRAALSFEYFDGFLDNLKRAAGQKITKGPEKVVEVLGKQFGINEGERVSVLRHLIEGADLSQFGLSAAITRTAQDIDSYDRASEFERFGFDIIELPDAQWEKMAVA